MISKDDCLMLLASMQKDGVDTMPQIMKIVESDKIDLMVLKFINDNRSLELTQFYELLRKNHNQKKSNVYINIMKESIEPIDVVITLNSYAQQVLLFAKRIEAKELFYRFSRLNEVYKVLYQYSNSSDVKICIDLLAMIKADIKALETIYRD